RLRHGYSATRGPFHITGRYFRGDDQTIPTHVASEISHERLGVAVSVNESRIVEIDSAIKRQAESLARFQIIAVGPLCAASHPPRSVSDLRDGKVRSPQLSIVHARLRF